jgi:ribosome-associated toxin RatA of RatAB toxin-antitoxin module
VIRGEKSATIEASPDVVWAVVSDLDGYPDWHPFFATVQVHDRDGDERARTARCTHGTPVGTLTTELEMRYEDGAEAEAKRTGGDFKQMSGLFALEAQGDLTVVTHRLIVDPGMRLGLLLRGPVEEKVRNSVLNGALTGLQQAAAARA